jgi:hypothetical protein
LTLFGIYSDTFRMKLTGTVALLEDGQNLRDAQADLETSSLTMFTELDGSGLKQRAASGGDASLAPARLVAPAYIQPVVSTPSTPSEDDGTQKPRHGRKKNKINIKKHPAKAHPKTEHGVEVDRKSDDGNPRKNNPHFPLGHKPMRPHGPRGVPVND